MVRLNEIQVGFLRIGPVGLAIVLVVLSASCSMSRVHLRARFSKAKGLQKGTLVYLEREPIGVVESISPIAPSEVSNQSYSAEAEPEVEVSLVVKGTINGQLWSERIRQDSIARKRFDIDFARRKARAFIEITPGTSLAQPHKENDVLSTN